jgi:hypothetical protein
LDDQNKEDKLDGACGVCEEILAEFGGKFEGKTPL